MAKKRFGKFVALATISGVIAAGISYFLKYKSFNNELDEEFHDFEGDEDEFDGELPHASETNGRAYVTLNEKKDDVTDVMKDAAAQTAKVVYDGADSMKDAAAQTAKVVYDGADSMKDAAAQTAKVVYDGADAMADAAEAAAEKAKDWAGNAADNAEDALDTASAKADDMSEMLKQAVTETADAVKNAAQSMSATIEDDDI